MKLTSRALFFSVFIFLLTLKTHRTYIGQGDEPQFIVVCESIWLDHDLDLRNNYVSPWLRSFDPQDHAAVKKADGREVPAHCLGLSIIGVPVYGIAHTIIKIASTMGAFTDKTERWIFVKNCFSISMMVQAGFLSVLLFKTFEILTGKRELSWFLALIFSLSPPLLAYGLIFFSELPTAFLIAWLMLRLIGERKLTVFDGILLGLIPWFHAKNYTVSLGLAAVFAYREGFSKSVVLPALTTIALWSAAMLTNYWLWGGLSPAASWSNAPYKTFDPHYFPISVPALFMDRSYGLFVFAPIYALFPCGLALMFVRQRKMAVTITFLVASYLISVAGFKFWWGGWSPGPRYLVPIVPLLTICVTYFVQAAIEKSAAWKKTIFFMLGATSALSLLYWQVPTLLWNQADGVNLFLIHWFGESGRKLQEILPNFFLPPIAPQFEACFYAAVLAVLSVVAFRKLRWIPDKNIRG